MAEYLSPGVYVEEYENLPRTMEGVATSVAGFVGLAERGTVAGAPVLIQTYPEFTRKFGDYLSEAAFGEYRYLASAVEQFFRNGGSRCYIARVLPSDAKSASYDNGLLSVTAANEGSWGNRVELCFKESLKKRMQLLEKIGDQVYLAKTTAGFEEGSLVKAGEEYNRIRQISDRKVTFEREFQKDVTDKNLVPENCIFQAELTILARYDDEVEEFAELSLYPASANYVDLRLKNSQLVKFQYKGRNGGKDIPLPGNPVTALLGVGKCSIRLEGGADGTKENITASTFTGTDEGLGKRTGIQAFHDNNTVSIIAVPGITIPEVINSLVAHCENTQSRFAVLDMPRDISDTGKLTEYRGIIDSTYAAMYHPWIQNLDRANKKPGYFPPSGAVMGVYSRTDMCRGVHKAPANETIACTGLNINFNKGEQDILNPKGINLIRVLPGQGIRVWGARTASANTTFKYVNIRRLFIYVEESIKANTGWVAFEPNDANLWNRVRFSIDSFLNTLFRNGMFAGASPSECYFIEIGPTTMSPDDIKNGRLIMNIGIAPSRPAEFVIFHITQHTAESSS